MDKWQYAISTSDAIECSIRNELVNKYGFEEGIEATINALDARNIKVADKKKEEIEKIKTKYYGI